MFQHDQEFLSIPSPRGILDRRPEKRLFVVWWIYRCWEVKGNKMNRGWPKGITLVYSSSQLEQLECSKESSIMMRKKWNTIVLSTWWRTTISCPAVRTFVVIAETPCRTDGLVLLLGFIKALPESGRETLRGLNLGLSPWAYPFVERDHWLSTFT